MPKELFFAAYEELTPNFVSNAWHLPEADTSGFATLEYWQDYVRELDAGGYDFLFLAEALGYPMTADGTVPEAVVREAVQLPVHDPVAIVSGLAATVSRLGFVVTASTASQIPALHARTFTTLDHLTGGRIGWNIVTTDMQEAFARLVGQRPTPHAERYARAEEFTELVLQLWESAWDEDAVRLDKQRRVWADPAKVHRIVHEGRYFSLDGYFPAIPSPQRTPTLFQAGTSAKGKEFAARYAECIFTSFRDTASAAAHIGELRARGAALSRPGLTVLNAVSILVGDTSEDAWEQRRVFESAPSQDASAALFLGWSGVDLSGYDPDTPLSEVTTEGSHTGLAFWQENPQTPTVGSLLSLLKIEAGGFKATGTAEEVADQLETIAREADVDGFLVEPSYGGIRSHRRVIDEVLPILRERGLVPAEPRGGTLRERLTAAPGPRLTADHPGAAYRR